MKKTLSIIVMLAMLLSTFTFLGALTTPVAAATTLGDINGDGVINAKDSLALKKYVASSGVTIVTGAADLNGDGAINSKDCTILKQYLAGAIDSFGGSSSSAPVKKITIAGNDISTYDIISMRPADGYRARECYSYGIRVFNNTLNWAVGFKLDVIGNSSELSTNARFSDEEYYSGSHNTSPTKPHHIYMIWEDGPLGDQGYSMKVENNGDLTIKGGYRTGIMNACYDLLDYIGYRCYQTGGQNDVGETIIPSEHVAIPAGLDKTFIPVFSYRDIATTAWNSSNGDPDQEVAMLCAVNHINATEDKAFASNAKYGFGIGNCWIHAHSFEYIFSNLGGAQPCLTNANNKIHAAAWWKGVLNERSGEWGQSLGYDLKDRVSISWNDNTNFCTCSNCMSAYRREESLSGTIVPFVNDVINDIRNSYNVRAYYIAYGPARIPPKYARPNDYCDISYCWNGCNNHVYSSRECTNGGNTKGWTNYKEQYYLDFWTKISDHIEGWYYSTTYGWNIGPCPNILNLREDFRYWADKGITMLYAEAEGDATLSFEPLRNNLMARLAWDPYMSEAEFQRRIDEFLEFFYGNGWRYIKQYLIMADEAGNRAGCFTNNYDWPGDMYNITYMYQNYDTFCNLFNQAKALANGDQANRIQALSIHMHFMCLCGACYVDGNGVIASNSTLSARYDEMWNYIDSYNFVASVYGQPTRGSNYNKNTSPFASFFDFEDWDGDGKLSGSWWEYYAPVTGRTLPRDFKWDPDVQYYYLSSPTTLDNNPLANWVP